MRAGQALPGPGAGHRNAPRWTTVVLAVILAALSAYAVLAGWQQTGILQRLAADSAKTDTFQQAVYLATRESALIQAAAQEPGGEEHEELPAVSRQTAEAMTRMAAMDNHAGLAQEIADRHRALQPIISAYLTALDNGDEDAAELALEESIEPAYASITDDLITEQDEHLDEQAHNQAIAERESRTLTGGSIVIFVLGLVVLTLFGLSTRAHRRLVEQMAATDALTGLPNRTAFAARTQMALAQANSHRRANVRRRAGGRPTVLTVNLDGFRDVNDVLGQRVGDRLLAEVGDRLRASVRGHDLVARLGGDEFAVLLLDADPQIGESTAQRLTAAFHRSFVLDEVAVDLEVSIGAATARPGDDVTTLLQHADIAMHAAKQQRAGFRRYSLDHAQDSAARLTLLGDLRRALDESDVPPASDGLDSDDLDSDGLDSGSGAGRIILHYQPKIAMDTAEVAGVEALARWQHPVKGAISPGEFIPVLESTNLIHQFTERVLRLALAQARAWLELGHRIPVAVNVSTRSLLDPAFADRVAALLREAGVPGDQLCIEVTEHTVMSDPSTAIEALRRVRELGIKTAIDDYGTGYSSMTYLKLLPLDELKVDRSFVQDMTRDRSSHALVESTVELGHNLGLAVVAEGVEDAGTLAALRDVGCDLAQGYHFARPMPPEQITARLRDARTLVTTALGGG